MRREQFPPEDRPEFAFLGRSNVGKSTLLNCLVRQKGLAFTSSRPGCTQGINFYEIDGAFRLVDLPGYGFARTSRDRIQEWKQVVEAYLMHRNVLQLSLLLLDARRGWMESDLELKRWLESRNRRYLVIATKMDKLKNQKQINHGLAAIRALSAEGEPVPFSAVTGQGVREIWQTIRTTSNRA